jgi:hypothetical protein
MSNTLNMRIWTSIGESIAIGFFKGAREAKVVRNRDRIQEVTLAMVNSIRIQGIPSRTLDTGKLQGKERIKFPSSMPMMTQI